MGKSTLCEWMVHLWCEVHTQQDKNHRQTEDEKLIAEFPLVFFISLRNSWADKTCLDRDEVEEMIKLQLGLKKYDIGRLLETENCLIILDGLDEWKPQEQRISTRKDSKDLPIQHAVGNFTVLTTSRPWKMEILRSELEGRVDKHISISGLGTASTDKLATNVVELLNKEYEREKKMMDFIKEIQLNNLSHFISIPVLLMQLVCLWHDGVEFGKSECEIYSNMIARLLQYAEKEKDLPELDDDDVDDLLPECLEKNKVFLRHGQLLHSLANLAFHTLFSKNIEGSLVFNHEETHIYGMTPVVLESCLKIGLLSQRICSEIKAITKEYKSISFMHKTHQEFFAALYLSTQDETSDIYETFSQAVSSLDRAIEFEKVLSFVCGMSPKMGGKLAERIMDAISNDKRIKEYRVACIDKWYQIPYRSFVEELQNMILKGLEEAVNNGINDCCLRLDDVVAVWMINWDEPNSENFAPVSIGKDIYSFLGTRNLHSLNVSKAKSLMFVAPRLSVPIERREGLNHQVNWFHHLHNLEKILLYDRSFSPKVLSPDNVLSIVGLSKHTLRSLVLMKIDFQELGNHFSEIFPHTNTLESFSLEKCELLHDQLEMLSEFFIKSPQLKQLKLNEITCKTCPKSETDKGESTCSFTIDLTGCNLEQLYLGKLYLNDLQVPASKLIRCELNVWENEKKMRDVLESLTAAKSLQTLYFRGRQEKVGESLAKVIPVLGSLESLTLRDIDFDQHLVSFSPNMDGLAQVKILAGSISDACLRSLVDSLPSCHVDVQLSDVDITNKLDWRQQSTLQYIRTSSVFVVTCDPDDDDWTSESTKSTMFFYKQGQ